MAQPSGIKKTAFSKRGKRGFASTGSLLSRQIRHSSEKRGFSQTRLLTHWAEVVGTTIAGMAQPVKVGYTKQGMGATLTLLVSGAQAPLVQMQIPQIIEKVNAVYGYAAISRVRLTQTSGQAGFAEAEAAYDPEPRSLSPAQKSRIETTVAGVQNPSLKEALETLGSNIAKKSKS